MSSGVTTPGSLTSPGSSSIPASSTTSPSSSTTSASSTTTSSSTSTSSTTTQRTSASPITTTSTTVFTPPITTSPSSSLPLSTSTTTFVTTPSSSSSSSSITSSSSSTSDAVTGSTSVAVSSGPNTIYSTTIVYVSGTDGRGSSYTSATAIGGGSGSRDEAAGNDTNIGAIVGGVVGGLGGIALIGVLAFCFLRKRKRDNRDALDEKMFDPGRNFHSSNSPAPIDLLSDHPRTNQISPYTAGLSSTNGYEGYNSGAAGVGAGAAAAAYGRNAYAPEERYERPTGGSADSSAWTHGSDAYLMNNGGQSQGYSSSSHAHGSGAGAGQDYLPNVGDHRLSGGWGVAAAGMGSPTQAGFGGGNGNASGYTARDYANYSQNGPGGGPDGLGSPYAAMMGAGAGAAGAAYTGSQGRSSYDDHEQDSYRPRMSAGAMAKLREARGEDQQSRGSWSNRGGSSNGFVGGHARRSSSNNNGLAYGGHSDGNYGVGPELDRRRSSAGLSGSGESSGHGQVQGYGYGDDGYGHRRRSSGGGGLVVHNDGGPVESEGEEDEDKLPKEIPPAYDAVPSDGRGQAL